MLNRPLTFATPSIVGDTPAARAKVEWDYKKIVRKAVSYFGPKRVEELNKEVAMERRGRKPDRRLDERLLAEWNASEGRESIGDFSEEFCKRHQQQSAGAVDKRLRRLLKERAREAERDRKLKAALQRPSLLNEVKTGTE
jgi:hypothetical protein